MTVRHPTPRRTAPAHLYEPPHVVVSPRRQMDTPDHPGEIGRDFPGCVA